MIKKIASSTIEDSLLKEVGNKCGSCDIIFSTENEFKDHILTTLHKGPPSEGTRNFK